MGLKITNGPNFRVGKPKPPFESKKHRKGKHVNNSEHSSRSTGALNYYGVGMWKGGKIK